MSFNALYTDLSGYYDVMCGNIDYRAQSNAVQRLHHIFGTGGNLHLDVACGTGSHVRHFIDNGYVSSGLINQPMLDIAAITPWNNTSGNAIFACVKIQHPTVVATGQSTCC